MTLDEIKDMWSKDCEIDDIELDKSSLDVPKLHAKYSDLLTDNILKLKYSDEISNDEKRQVVVVQCKMDDKNQRVKTDDPFDGLKILKNDMQVL